MILPEPSLQTILANPDDDARDALSAALLAEAGAKPAVEAAHV